MRVSRSNYFALAGFQHIQTQSSRLKGAATGSERSALQTESTDSRRQDISSLQELLPQGSLKKINNAEDLTGSSLIGRVASKTLMTPALTFEKTMSRITHFLDRAQGASSREEDLATVEFFEAERELADPDLTNTDIEITEDDLQFLRSAIEDELKRATVVDPTLTSEDFNALLDSSFANGLSSIFSSVRTDDGDGDSTIRLSQVNPDQLANEDKAVIALAIESAHALYSETKAASPHLETLEAKSLIEDLSQTLGKTFDPDLSDLERGLHGAVEGGAAEAIDDLRSKIEESAWLSDEQKDSALGILNDLSQLNETSQENLSSPALFEDLRITFRSGSYLRAFSPDEIAAVIENTPAFGDD